MDKNKSLSPLERYLEAKRENKDLYMDTFEIETLLNYLEDNDNLMYYEEIVKLGLKLHPGNFYMRLKEARYFMLIEEYPKALRYLAMLRHEDPYNEDRAVLHRVPLPLGQPQGGGPPSQPPGEGRRPGAGGGIGMRLLGNE